ncbi:MAG: FAD binding domain-containing protein [Chloroflexota bacterium]
MEALPMVKPRSIEEALRYLREQAGEGVVFAGGTDLMPDLRKGRKKAALLVDVRSIPELMRIEISETQVVIGAGVTFFEIASHPFIQERVPALAEAARSVGAWPLQTMATWGGNLVQAMPAADGAIIALALEAQARLVNLTGEVWKEVSELFRGPGKSAIDPSAEFITALRFPLPQGQWGTAWQRLGRRPALTLPILNCAVKLEMDAEQVGKAVIALGPVAPTPYRCRQAEGFLVGKFLDGEIMQEAAEIARGESQPRGNVLRASAEYRKAVIPVLVRRALHQAWERAVLSKDKRNYPFTNHEEKENYP